MEDKNVDSDKKKNIFVPIEEAIEEEEKQNLKDTEEIDEDFFNVKEIIGVLPLEPVIIIASVGEEKNISDLKTIGIPGFINPSTKNFFLLDGTTPSSLEFRKKIRKFLEKKEN